MRGLEVVQRVAVLGEDDELLVRRGLRRRRSVSARHRAWPVTPLRSLPATVKISPKQARQLAPLGVRAAVADGEGERFQALSVSISDLQLGDGARRGRLIEDLLLGGLDLVVRRVVEVLDVLGVERGRMQPRGPVANCAARAGAAPARAAGFPAARGGDAATGRSPRARRRAAAAGWSARSRRCPPACRSPAPRRD